MGLAWPNYAESLLRTLGESTGDCKRMWKLTIKA